jgi:hypothetical protein
MQSSIIFLGYLTNSDRRRFEVASMFFSCFFPFENVVYEPSYGKHRHYIVL